MTLLYRSVPIVAWIVVVLLTQPASIDAAELRTTLCDRPVCRTVAIAPDTTVRPKSAITESLSTDEVFEDFDGGCQGGCSHGCQMCCLPKRDMWADADFLLGWRHGIRFPALATTSPNGTNQLEAGVLPGATIVYPSQPVGEEARPGGRVSLGTWLDDCHCWGVEGRYFMLADEITTFSAQSTGDPILARPFFDVAGNAQATRLLAFPGAVSPGSIDIATESELLGGDALLRRGLCRWECGNLDFLVGYQFARLNETLQISDVSTDVDPGNLIQDGTTFAITDQFATRNQYHAASVGAAMKFQRFNWQWEVLGKIGLGNMRETVTVAGTTTAAVPGQAVVVEQFGLLAQGVNLGTVTEDKFCASPELNLKVAYQVTRSIDVSCGYTFLYFTSVAQPGRMVDVGLGVPTDRFRIRDSEFWMHAFQCGVTMRF